MATVPTAPRVTANQISPQKTDLTGITEFRNAGATAKAQTQFGQAAIGFSDQVAKLGAQIQLGDEKRDLTQRELEIRKVFQDAETGSTASANLDGMPGTFPPEQSISGYRSETKEVALRGSAARKKGVEDRINEILDREGSAGWVSAELRLRAQNRGQVFDSGYEAYLMDQRLAADEEVATANLYITGDELASIMPNDPNILELEEAAVAEITAIVRATARAQGTTNEKVIDSQIAKELSIAHTKRIKWLQSKGYKKEAENYYSRIEGQLTADAKTDLGDLTRTGLVQQKSMDIVNNMINEGDLDGNAYKTEFDMITALRKNPELGDDPLAFNAARTRVVNYWRAKNRAETDRLNVIKDKLNLGLATGDPVNLSAEETIIVQKSGDFKKYQDAVTKSNGEMLTKLPNQVKLSEIQEHAANGTLVNLNLLDEEWATTLGSRWIFFNDLQATTRIANAKASKKAILTEKDLIAKLTNPSELWSQAGPLLLATEGFVGTSEAAKVNRAQVKTVAADILLSRVQAGERNFTYKTYKEIMEVALSQVGIENKWSFFDQKVPLAEAIMNGETIADTDQSELVTSLANLYPRINKESMQKLVTTLIRRKDKNGIPAPVLPSPKAIDQLLRAIKRSDLAGGSDTSAAVSPTQIVAPGAAADEDGYPAIDTPTVRAVVAKVDKKVNQGLKVNPASAKTPAAIEYTEASKTIVAQKQELEKRVEETNDASAQEALDITKEVFEILSDTEGTKSGSDIARATAAVAERRRITKKYKKLEALNALFKPMRVAADAFRVRHDDAQAERLLGLQVDSFDLANEQGRQEELRSRIGSIRNAKNIIRQEQAAKVATDLENGRLQMAAMSELLGIPDTSVGQGMEDSEAVADQTVLAETMGDSEAVADQTVLAETMGDSDAVADQTAPVGQGMEDSEAVADPISVSPEGKLVPVEIPSSTDVAPLKPDELKEEYDQGKISGIRAKRIGRRVKNDATRQYNKTLSSIDQLKMHEGGKVPFVYPDGDGNLTAGIGHKLSKDELARWKEGDMISNAQAEKWFKADYALAKRQIATIFKDTLTFEARDVLVSMVFNMGLGYATKRTPEELGFGYPGEVIPGKGLKSFGGMLRALKSSPPDYARAAEEMMWVNADTKTANTKWYNQTGNRAKDLINIMKSQKR